MYHIESLSDKIETISNGYEQKEAIYAIHLHFFVTYLLQLVQKKTVSCIYLCTRLFLKASFALNLE